MRHLALVLLLATAGCATSYKPMTMAGAQCKKECATARMGCQAFPGPCDRGATECYASCQEMETLNKGGN